MCDSPRLPKFCSGLFRLKLTQARNNWSAEFGQWHVAKKKKQRDFSTSPSCLARVTEGWHQAQIIQHLLRVLPDVRSRILSELFESRQDLVGQHLCGILKVRSRNAMSTAHAKWEQRPATTSPTATMSVLDVAMGCGPPGHVISFCIVYNLHKIHLQMT